MKYSILVVDDEVNLRITLSGILQQGGYFVSTTGSGEEALALLSAIQYDLVFLDLKMPGLDGIDLILKIRTLSPDLPIVILTANASLETAVKCLRMGASGYLLKPVDPELILAKVKDVLQEYASTHRKEKIIDEIQKLLFELDAYETS